MGAGKKEKKRKSIHMHARAYVSCWHFYLSDGSIELEIALIFVTSLSNHSYKLESLCWKCYILLGFNWGLNNNPAIGFL